MKEGAGHRRLSLTSAVQKISDELNPATWNPPTLVGGGMRLHSSREAAEIKEASGFSRRSVTNFYSLALDLYLKTDIYGK
jgi:hypothetical protein